MNVFIIPVSDTIDPFDQQTELDGVIYDMTFRWNSRDRSWHMDVGRDGIVLVSGVKLIETSDVLSQYQRINGLPVGVMSVVDLDGLGADPDDVNFGDRVVMQYTETV